MTTNKPLDQHRTRVGAKRKEALKRLAWAHDALDKCRNEAEELQVLRALIHSTRDLVQNENPR